MKRFTLLLSLVVVLAGCYRGDIDDLNRKYDQLSAEQKHQAELIAALEQFMHALEGQLTVSSVTAVDEGGYRIVFSDGSELKVGSAIVSVVDDGGTVTFNMSDGSTVTMRKTETVGLYALAEGSWGQGNGQLLYFDYDPSSNRFVVNDSKRFINYGETPNDLLIYGSKMYCAITGPDGSNAGRLVRVIDVATGATIRDIAVRKDADTLQPRRLAVHGGKVYASLYSGGLARIDTLSYAVDVIALGGDFSEGLCVYGESLYVCNSGQGAGNTVSVVSLVQFVETGTITVPHNPVNIISAGNGELFLNTAGVWSGVSMVAPPNVHVIDAAGKRVSATLDVEVESIAAGKGYVYGAGFSWNTFSDTFKKISIGDKSVSDFTDADGMDEIIMIYKLSVNPLNGDVLLTQQMGDYIYRFKADGTYVESLRTGKTSGSALAFVNTTK